MPPKKTEGASKAKATTTAGHSYQDMIKDAIINLKERNGSSRVALKKYVKANNKITVSDNMFDGLFNRALKSGVEKGEFAQPKGSSGGTKLAKKEPKPAAAKPAAAKKAAAPKKTTTAKKPAAAKKAPVTKKTTASKPAATKKAPTKAAAPKKAKAAAPKAKKAAAPKAKAAPAVVEKSAVLGKTASGRVTKTTAKSAPKKAAPKKPATKKATPKKAAA